ncbi:homeodomain-like protein [Trichoderma arundinaceum]|uniref:Homeodomain-like protein n=1 Tax=Trichoderma arundinaceum TaxID=490622 RepID=A0A395N8J0_TRIAR|nr:homeodomain-like protein [Trichoderma arundinaceum]
MAEQVATIYAKPSWLAVTAEAQPDSIESIEKDLESSRIMFDSVDVAQELGWLDSPTINQAAKEAASSDSLSISTSSSLAEYLSILPPTPPASCLPQADKASQSIMESTICPVNCLMTTNSLAEFDSIPTTPKAYSSIQNHPGVSAGQDLDVSDNEHYHSGSEPSRSTIMPSQWTEDSHSPSTPDHNNDGHGLTHDNISSGDCGSVGGDEDNNDDSGDDDYSTAYSDTEYCETSSGEQEAAGDEREQPPRKRRKVMQSLSTNKPNGEEYTVT